MTARFTLICAHEAFPTTLSGRRHNGIIGLYGALPRSGQPGQEPAEWRQDEAYPILEELGYDGWVLTPERAASLGSMGHRQTVAVADYVGQVDWEQEAQTWDDVSVYYLTRTEQVKAFSTNTELGQQLRFGAGRVVLCIPQDASLALKTEFQQAVARMHGIEPVFGLRAGLAKAVAMIGAGAERHGGACQVPLNVWRTPSFQSWYAALEAAGNRLDGFQLETTLCPVPTFVLYWVARVNIWVASEQRHKSNEWVISRPDISHIVLVYRDRAGTQLVHIDEFRSPVRNGAGLVSESAGGSSAKPHLDPIEVGIQEVEQEIGMRLLREQLTIVGSRQLAATMNTAHAFVLVGELTAEQYAWVREHEGCLAGNAAETEQTRLGITSVADLFGDAAVGARFDWSQTGMAAAALLMVDADHKAPYTVTPHAGVQHVVVAAEGITGAMLSTLLGMMAAGTTLVVTGSHRSRSGFERRINLPGSLANFAARFREHGLTANLIQLDDMAELAAFFATNAATTSVLGFVGDYGIAPDVAAVAELARRHGIPVIGSWCGSTPEPELRLVNDSLVAPDDGYLPFARSWTDMARAEQLGTAQDAVVVSIGRITPAAYYELTRLMIGGTRVIYGGAPIGVPAPPGRIHITSTLDLMRAKLGVAHVPAGFTWLEERDMEARRLELLALAKKLRAPVLAFADDQGLPPGVVQECEWASRSGLPVIGLWAGSGSALSLRLGSQDSLDFDPDALSALAKLQATSLSLVGAGS